MDKPSSSKEDKFPKPPREKISLGLNVSSSREDLPRRYNESDSFHIDSTLTELFQKFVETLPAEKKEQEKTKKVSSGTTLDPGSPPPATPNLQEMFKNFYTRHYPGYTEEDKAALLGTSSSQSRRSTRTIEFESSFQELLRRYSSMLPPEYKSTNPPSAASIGGPCDQQECMHHRGSCYFHGSEGVHLKWRDFLPLVGGFLINLALGHAFSLANLGLYVLSLLKAHTSFLMWLYCIHANSILYSVVLGAWLERQVGVLITASVGCFLHSLGLVTARWAVGWSISLTLLTYGLVAGMGVGLAYSSILTYQLRRYRARHSMINGLATLAFAIGGAAAVMLQTITINPDNLRPGDHGRLADHAVETHVKSYLTWIGVGLMGLQLCGLAFLGAGFQTGLPRCSRCSQNVMRQLPASDPLSDRHFYVLWLLLLLTSPYLQFIFSFYKVFGQEFDHSDLNLAIIGAGCAVVNALSRQFWVFLHRRSNFRNCMLLNCSLMALLTFVYPLVSISWRHLFSVWALLSFINAPGIAILFPRAIGDFFGEYHYMRHFSLLGTAFLMSSVINPLLLQLIHSVWNYAGDLFYMGCLSILGFCACLILSENAVIIMQDNT